MRWKRVYPATALFAGWWFRTDGSSILVTRPARLATKSSSFCARTPWIVGCCRGGKCVLAQRMWRIPIRISAAIGPRFWISMSTLAESTTWTIDSIHPVFFAFCCVF
ncbi:hypothetical protein BKA82DRAFT_4191455 [Pisolithus tinctorius]|nr:hypothetical protein BKA82DRAFT_4191455 [Pisolithus tinctorius]